jgi:hypothetical protein
MTVSTTTRKAGPFIGNGVTTAFPFTFKVFSASDLAVILTDAAGAETTLTLNADYSVSLNADQDNDPGGTVTYSYGGIPLPSTQKLTILSSVPLLQLTDIQNRGGFFPQVIEDALDRVTIMAQQAEELLGRAVRLPVSDSATNAELPTAVARANKALVFDEDGNIAVSEAGWQVEVTHGNVVRQTHVKDVDFVAGGTTLFLTSDAFIKENVHILFGGTAYGVELQQTAFSLAGATVTLVDPIPSDVDQIETWYIQPLAVGSINDGVVTDAKVAADAAIDANKLNFVQAGVGAVARSVRSKARDVVSFFDFMTEAERTDAMSGTPALDHTASMQKALTASLHVVSPPGATYKITTPLVLRPGGTVVGEQSQIQAWGCDCFTVPAAATNVVVEKFFLNSFSGVGVPNPKLYKAINCAATAPANQCSDITTRDLTLTGWAVGVRWAYTWNSLVDNVTATFCDRPLQLFGQSVNNSVINSVLTANGGVASVDCVDDAGVTCEGLTIANCLLSSGTYGIVGGPLSINVSNCIIDLIGDTAFKMTNPIALTVSNCWIYAANTGFLFAALGLPQELGASLTGNHITVTASAGKGVNIQGVNNLGVSITGGSITCGATGYCVWSESGSLGVVGVNLVNPSSNPSVSFQYGSNNSFSGCTGNATAEYVNGKPPRSMAATIPAGLNALAYGPAMTPDCLDGSTVQIVITNNVAFTINNPTNPPNSKFTGQLTFVFFNLSGGAAGALTWGVKYKTAGAFVLPGNNGIRTISFQWIGGDRWVETARTTADSPL